MTAKTLARLLLLLLLVLAPAALPTAATAAAHDVHFEAGLKAFTAEDYLKAAEAFTLSLEAHPTAKAALYLGNAYLKLGQLGKAKEALERVLQIDPTTNRRELILKLVQGIASRNVGVIKISSIPAGATIYLDEKDARGRGKAPIELSLPPGKHRVIAELAGYESVAKEVTVAFGETSELEFALQITGCDLALSAKPPSGRAAVDGGPAVAMPTTVRVAPGDHHVAFSAAGFEPQELPVRCAAAPLSLSAVLNAVPAARVVPRRTAVELTVNVPNAQLTVDGAPVGPGGALALSAGAHQLRASAAGYRPLRTQVSLAEGELLRAQVQLVRPSYYALGAAVTLTALAATAEILALVAHSQAAATPVDSPTYGSHQDTETGLHIAAATLAAGAIVGYALEFALVRSSLGRRGEPAARLGVTTLPQGGAVTLAGRF